MGAVADVAKLTGTSEADVEFMARLMINQMKKDGLTLEQVDTEAVEAYAISANDTAQSIATTCLTKPAAKRYLTNLHLFSK